MGYYYREKSGIKITVKMVSRMSHILLEGEESCSQSLNAEKLHFSGINEVSVTVLGLLITRDGGTESSGSGHGRMNDG